MTQPNERDVDRFILDEIDSVPHLEALLLVWSSRPQSWSDEELGKRLYLENPAAMAILEDLQRRGLIAAVPGEPRQFRYESSERDPLLEAVESAYRTDLVRISTMIHLKAPASVLEFARAFRFTKER